jgi:hypothetical protein
MATVYGFHREIELAVPNESFRAPCNSPARPGAARCSTLVRCDAELIVRNSGSRCGRRFPPARSGRRR